MVRNGVLNVKSFYNLGEGYVTSKDGQNLRVFAKNG